MHNFLEHKAAVQRFFVVLAIIVLASVSVLNLPHRDEAGHSFEANQEKPELPAVSEPPQTVVAGLAPLRKHVVQSGETLSNIAEQYQLDVATLLAANDLSDDTLRIGQELTILPGKGVLHTVRAGDTLWEIARAYQVDIPAIVVANGKKDDNAVLAEGEKLFIPGGRLPLRQASPVSRGTTSRFLWPTRGEITSPFGYRWGRLHSGIDIANDVGTPVRGAMAGKVTFSGWCDGYGKTVILEHGRGYSTLYGHLSQSVVQPGQFVEAGEVIAYMGNTGWSTGPHLHFEVRLNDQPLNPLQVLP